MSPSNQKVLVVLAGLLIVFIALIGAAEPKRKSNESVQSNRVAAESHSQTGSSAPSFIPFKLWTGIKSDEVAAYCATKTDEHDKDWAKSYYCDIKITDVYIGIFNALLVVVTVGLIVVGFLTVDRMRITEQRELRAYVGIVITPETVVNINVGMKPTCPLIIKNHGQTPAHGLESAAGIVIREYPLVSPLPSPWGFSDGEGSKSALHPDQQFEFWVIAEQAITPADMQALQTGDTVRAYLFGEVKYLDVFGRDRHTTYKLVTTGRRAGHSSFVFCKEGNEAD